MLLRIVGWFVVLFLILAPVADASWIDSFDAGTQSLFVSSTAKNASEQLNLSPGVAIGNYRDLALEWKSGLFDFASVSMSGPQGLFVFSQLTTDSTGKGSITWDGSNTPGDLAFDLMADLRTGSQDRFLIDVNATTGSGMALMLKVYTDETHYSTASIPLSGVSSGAIPVLFDSFTPAGIDGGAIFTSVGAIVLEFDGTEHSGSSVILNSISTVAVPEPSSLAMMATFGALALLGMGRRWKRT